MDSALCAEVCKVKWLEARSGGVSTTMKMCIQADLDTAGAIRHMNKNKSERAVCSLHPPQKRRHRRQRFRFLGTHCHGLMVGCARQRVRVAG